ncbi:MAG: HAMP domain-containing histidine kinase, partial [Thermomicrobiaceae bacterium]|nr:HAMP domain-containing histidine kinase [Thermomicrobiaceae bacterium]
MSEMSPASDREEQRPSLSSPPSTSLAARIEAIGGEVAGRDIGALLARVSDGLARIPSVRAVGVWLINPKDETLRLQSWSATRTLPLGWDTAAALDAKRSALARLLHGEQARQISAHAVAGDLLPADADAASLPPVFAALPLVRRERLGLIGLFCDRWLTEEELATAALLTHQVAAEIAAARLEEIVALRAEPAAEKGEASLERFVSLIAHELRTPLTGLRGNVQLAAMAAAKGAYDRIAPRLQAALQNVDTITALVQNLQDISHLERGTFALAPVPADLTATVATSVRRVMATAPERHTIEVEAPESIVTSHDVRRLEHVFLNLLTNALKYSPDGGTIHVRIQRQGDQAVVSITDPGVGVRPEERERIFDPYYRG